MVADEVRALLASFITPSTSSRLCSGPSGVRPIGTTRPFTFMTAECRR
jgi:hypothetical protein